MFNIRPKHLPNIPSEAKEWVLQVVCSANSIAIDPVLLKSNVSDLSSWANFSNVCEGLGINSVVLRKIPSNLESSHQILCFVPSKYLSQISSSDASQDAKFENNNLEITSSEVVPVIILQIRDSKALILVQGAAATSIVAVSDLVTFENAIRFNKVSSSEDSNSGQASFGYRWLWAELVKFKSAWRDVLVASLLIQLIGLVLPLMTQTIIDKVITNRTESTLIVIITGLAIVTLFNVILSWIRQYLVLHTGNKVDAVLGSKVFGHLISLPAPYFESRPTGTLVTRLHGVDTIRDFITGAFITAVLDVPFMLIFFVIMFSYSPILSLISLGVAVVMAIISFYVAPVLRDKSNSQYMAGASVQSFTTEYISGMESVKSLQMESKLNSEYSHLMANYMQKGFEAKQVSNSYNSAMTFLDQTSNIAILGVGAWMAMTEPGFTIGMLVAFQMFASRATQPLIRLSSLWQQFQQANIALSRIGDIMTVPSEKYSYVPTSVRATAPRIEVSDLGFSYSQDRSPLYSNLSFNIDAGQCVAIVGLSGCGKSTIAKLMQGFYVGYSGNIKIGGRDLRSVSVNELRAWFGVVPQETTLFSGTIKDNLQAANARVSLTDIANVCKLAGVHDAIEQLPNGYLTMVGERGTGLSGGQKQRIAIARALLKGASVLIFDESTANLDPHSANAVAETINALKGKLTIIFVAHNLPSALKVDRIIRLPDGSDIPVPISSSSRG